MAFVSSIETQVSTNPQKFAMAQPSKLLTKLKGEPPVNLSKGRRRNPINTKIYNELITCRDVWCHVNIPITGKKHLASIRASLSARAKKDNLTLATASLFNEETQTIDLWVMLTA